MTEKELMKLTKKALVYQLQTSQRQRDNYHDQFQNEKRENKRLRDEATELRKRHSQFEQELRRIDRLLGVHGTHPCL